MDPSSLSPEALSTVHAAVDTFMQVSLTCAISYTAINALSGHKHACILFSRQTAGQQPW